LTPPPSSPSLPPLSILTTQNVIISKKIRINPSDEEKWFEALNLYRRAYNLAIEFMRKGRKPSSEFRTQICDWCQLECEENAICYNSNLIQAAYREACQTRANVIAKHVKGERATMSFKSRNASEQAFIAPRLSKKKAVFPLLLGTCHWFETVPDEAIGKTVIVKYQQGHWFACVQKIQIIPPQKTNTLSIISLDPGVRTFQTGFSQHDATQYGDQFVETKLVPLMLEMDRLISLRDQLHKKDRSQQWVQDRLRFIHHKMNEIRVRKKNLVEDLHRRVAYDLVKNYDLILLPTFETKKMSQKSTESRKRFLRRKTVRGMLGLAHYKFKLTLKWMAKKYGKTVIDVNESYTSKTLWDGSLLKNLGGKASILFQGIRVNRDIHGARNILIRFLTKVAKQLSLPPKDAYSLDIIKTVFCGFGVLK
jgi:IS605 OrfB family transposase